MEVVVKEGDRLDPDQAAGLLASGVVTPGCGWLAAALGTMIPCRSCGRHLRVVPVPGPGRDTVAVDSEGRLVFGSDSVARDALGVRLCDACFELAGWENTHSDEGHEEKPDPDCPLCGTPEPARGRNVFELFTHRYQDFEPSMGVPVRITLGAPRWTLPYSLEHQVREAAPSREYFGSARPVYEAAYRAQLDRHGVKFYASRFQGIAKAAGDLRLVLLCFEDLSKPDQWCHRRMFAAWWKERTGEKVRELGPLGPAFEQGTLL